MGSHTSCLYQDGTDLEGFGIVKVFEYYCKFRSLAFVAFLTLVVPWLEQLSLLRIFNTFVPRALPRVSPLDLRIGFVYGENARRVQQLLLLVRDMFSLWSAGSSSEFA